MQDLTSFFEKQWSNNVGAAVFTGPQLLEVLGYDARRMTVRVSLNQLLRGFGLVMKQGRVKCEDGAIRMKDGAWAVEDYAAIIPALQVWTPTQGAKRVVPTNSETLVRRLDAAIAELRALRGLLTTQ